MEEQLLVWPAVVATLGALYSVWKAWRVPRQQRLGYEERRTYVGGQLFHGSGFVVWAMGAQLSAENMALLVVAIPLGTALMELGYLCTNEVEDAVERFSFRRGAGIAALWIGLFALPAVYLFVLS